MTMNNLQQSLVDAEWLRREDFKEHITTLEAAALVKNREWQFARYYVDTCRWERVCEPANDGIDARLIGSIYYIERRPRGYWERMLNMPPLSVVEHDALVASGYIKE